MINPLLWLTLALAVLDWYGLWKESTLIGYFTKPGTLLALTAWSYQVSGWQDGMLWFGIALVFSWLGDVLLIFPKRFFLAGLTSFLTAHLFYLVGLNLKIPPMQAGSFAFTVAVASGTLYVGRIILNGLKKNPLTQKLRVPVILYSTAVSLMFLSTLLTLLRPDWPPSAAGLAASGGALFLISDTLLAYNLFVRPFRHGVVYVHITYHLGQILLISGALLRFTS
jgi:alkenylglycerophosphocholine/alkenylglycerophosphoethanolamine hydrolase